ncbi:hypothetical protein BDN72DRAFT_813961 [Pluteus cervinus]|uniref:Uncharacterized protein n=1 Tax=Pluteus cervinus TaxID=181527 RepID=A0ACD3B7B4_9AGAR|nr:hypothetical protein BDN72DRAFT_813961 [Pluteus cervinus]
MLFLLTAALAVLRAQAAPFSAGPATVPTIIHTLVFGIRPRADGSGADLRNLGEVVWSCLLTIGACVYQAVHPDVPDVTSESSDKFRGRFMRTLWALMAPEAIIFWALKQRSGAKIVATRVNEVVPSLGWERTQGHFAQMGGFASKEDNETLFPLILIQLLKDGRLDIEELRSVKKEDILDKSKGDWLSKSLVGLQTTWFVCECLARLQQHLPLLELEVATLGFATLNVLTYALWWSKPLNVGLHVQPLPTTTSTTSTLSDTPSEDPSEPTPDRIPSRNPSQDAGLLEEEKLELISLSLEEAFAGLRHSGIDIFEQNPPDHFYGPGFSHCDAYLWAAHHPLLSHLRDSATKMVHLPQRLGFLLPWQHSHAHWRSSLRIRSRLHSHTFFNWSSTPPSRCLDQCLLDFLHPSFIGPSLFPATRLPIPPLER